MAAGLQRDNETPSLSVRRLVAYGVLALPLAALNLPLYVYLPTFYASELGLDLAAVGIVLLVARLFDVVSDPVIGELGDRTQSRFGQRKPWIAASIPILILSSFFLFMPPASAGLWHLLLWSCLSYIAWTMILLSYGAWGAELSPDHDERTRITGFREAFVIVGIVLAAALPAVLGVEPGSRPSLTALFWVTAGLLLVTGLVALSGVPEPEHASIQKKRPFADIKTALANRPFRRLITAYLLNGAANGLPASLFILFTTHVIGRPDWAGPLLLLYFLAGIAGVPFWLFLSKRIGKHKAWCAAMLWACLTFATVPLLGEGAVVGFAIICLLSGFSLGADMALPPSMQADVVDLDRVQTGRRRTGLFFAAWSMATKLSLALAVGVAFPVLDAAGFDPNADNDRIAIVTLVTLYGILPVVIKLAAIRVIWPFEIDAAEQARLRERIKLAQGQEP